MALTKTGSVKLVQPTGFGMKSAELDGNDNTARAVLTKAGVNVSGFEIRVNNNPANLDSVLNPGDVVLLLQQVKGN